MKRDRYGPTGGVGGVPTQLPAVIWESPSHGIRLVGTGRTSADEVKWTIEVREGQDSMLTPRWRPYREEDRGTVITALVESILK